MAKQKSVFFAILIALTVFVTVIFSACDGNDADAAYTVDFYNGEVLFATVETKWGEEVSFPTEVPTKASDESYDYVFLGWGDSPTATQAVSGSVKIYADAKFYAVYSKQEKDGGEEEITYFTVTFVDDYTGLNIGEPQSVEMGGNAELPTPPDHTADGYVFSGWSASHENIRRTTTIRALYERNSVTLTRHYLGQSRQESVISGSAISTDAPTISSAFVFEGWFWDEEFTDAVQSGNDVMPLVATDIYAKISVDFSSAELAEGGELVYGNQNVVSVTGLVGEGTLEYSFDWIENVDVESAENDNAKILRNAGNYDLGVTVTATYEYNGNVVLTDSVQLSGSFEVKKATLNVTLSALEQITYGSTAQINVNYDGEFKYQDNADMLNLVLTYTRYDDISDTLGQVIDDNARLSVGYYVVSAQVDELSNYEIPQIQSVSFTVNKKEFNISYSVEDYTYGDDLNDGFNLVQYYYDQSEFAYGDDISCISIPQFEIQTVNYSDANALSVGTYVIAPLADFSAENYEIKINSEDVDAEFKVNPKPATVNVSASNWTYGQEPVYSHEINGILEGDNVSVSYVFTRFGNPYMPTGAHMAAGDYTVTVQCVNQNYEFNDIESISFTVEKAQITAEITFTNSTFSQGIWQYVYGEEPKYEISYSGTVFVNESEEDMIKGSATVVYEKDGQSGNAKMLDAGLYEVLISGLDNLENYVYTKPQKVELLVSKKAITVELVAKNTQFTYGDNVNSILDSFDYSCSELAYNQSLTTALRDLSKELRDELSGETVTARTPNAGDYLVTVTYSQAANYEVISVLPARVTVDKAALNLSIENEQITYGSTPSKELKIVNFKGSDENKVQALLSYEKDGKEYALSDNFPVGEYKTVVAWTNQEVLDNYEWSQPNGSLTVIPKQLTLSLSVQNVVYGNEIAPQYALEGFVFGETTESVFHQIALTYFKGDNVYEPKRFSAKTLFDVGEYEVELSGLTSQNYTVMGENRCAFAVTAQAITVRDSRTYDRLNNTWSFTPQIEGYEFSGSLKLNETDAGVYVWNTSKRDNQIDWVDGYSITLEGKDITQNFVLNYDVLVELTASNFNFTEPSDKMFVYDAESHVFPISVDGALHEIDEGAEITVEYSLDGTTFVEQAPTFVNVGEKTVYYRISAFNYVTIVDSFSVKGIVSSENYITVENFRNAEFLYDGNFHEFDIAATARFGSVVVLMNDGNSEIELTENASIKDAGNYVFRFVVFGDGNYETVEEFRTVTINKANYTVTENKPQNGYVYDGNNHGHGITALPLDGDQLPTVTYVYGGQEIDSISFKDAGEYLIEWFIPESKNYNLSNGEYTVVINRAPNQITANMVESKIKYDGKAHGFDFSATAIYGEVSVTLNGNAVMSDFTVKDVGIYEFVFTVEQSQNYQELSITRAIEITRGDYSISNNGDQTGYVYNGNNHGHGITALPLDGDEMPTVIYTYGGELIESVSFKDAGNYLVEWSIPQSDNYNGANGSFTVKIDAFELVVDVEATMQSYVYNAGAQGYGLVLANASPDNEFTVYYSEQGFSEGTADFRMTPFTYVNVGAYTVFYRITGSNYKTVTGDYTVSITAKELTVQGLPSSNVKQKYSSEGYELPQLSVVGVAQADLDKVSISVWATKDNAQVEQIKNKGLYYVNYTVEINNAVKSNYKIVESGFYTVTIEQLSVSLDENSISKSYTYNGEEQSIDLKAIKIMSEGNLLTLEQIQQDDSTARLEFAATKGSLTQDGIYSFTNVNDANGAYITITLSVGANCNYSSAYVTFIISVAKANYTQADLPQVEIDEQIMMLGKKIGQIQLTDGFVWDNANEQLLLGKNEYKAYYNVDSSNYNDYELYIQITARKEVITVTYLDQVEAVKGEVDANNYKQFFTVDVNGEILREGTTLLSDKELTEDKFVYTVSGIDYSVGGTYVVTYTLTILDNPYFELDPDNSVTFTTWFKLKSALYNGEYYTIEDALNVAESGIIRLMAGETSFTSLDTLTALRQLGYELYVSDSYYTVKSDVTLLLPYGESDNVTITQNKDQTNYGASGTNLYSKLTVANGLSIINNGLFVINGVRANNDKNNYLSHTLKENGYSEIVINDNATITVNSGAQLICFGFSYGNGQIIAKSGATVTEPFSLTGWKGGSISSAIVRSSIFPINQFAIVNIINTLKIEYGATYNARAAVSASSQFIDVDVEFISSNNSAFLQLIGGSSYVTKYVNETNGQNCFDVHGKATFNTLSIDVGLTASTNNIPMPIPGNFKISLIGCNVTIPNRVKIKFLPGATVIVDENSSVQIQQGGEISFYGAQGVTFSNDLTQWQDGNHILTYPLTEAFKTKVYRIAPTLEYNQTTPARFINYGVVTVLSGATLAASVEGGQGAKVVAHEGANLTATVKEDYNEYDKIANLVSSKSFTSTIESYGLGNTSVALQNDGSYVYNGGDWQRVEPFKYTINYNANGGNLTGDQSQSFTIYITEPLPQLTLNSFDTPNPTHPLGLFTGWYLDEGCTQPVDVSNPLTVYNGNNITVYAGWQRINYTVEYIVIDYTGQNEYVNQNVTSWAKDDVVELNDLITQYDFGGWFIDQSYKNSITKIDDALAISYGYEDGGNRYIKIYGYIYDANEEYEVVYDLNLDGLSTDYTDYIIKDLPIGNTVKVNQKVSGLAKASDYNLDVNDYDVTKEYYFAGWYVGDKLITDDTIITAVDVIDGKLTLTAKWAQKVKLTVTVTATGERGLFSKGDDKTATYTVSFEGTDYTDSHSVTSAGGALLSSIKTVTENYTYYLRPNQSYTVTADEGSGGASGEATESDTEIQVTVENS